MEVNNIKYNNVSPFTKNIFKSDHNINFNDVINSIPTIPKIYFNENDNYGNNIINNYNFIRININKLRIIKNFIISILKTSKIELENIQINRNKYQLRDNNLIINFDTDYNETFSDKDKIKEFEETHNIKKYLSNNKNKFNEFIKIYLEENYNIFKNIKIDEPYFYNIFQNEYINTDNIANKTFFLDLFKKYIKIRKLIIPYIKTNNGLLGFNMIFDIKDNIYLSKIINDEKSKLEKSKNSKKSINYSKYILNGENIINNSENIIPTARVLLTSKEEPTKSSLKFKIQKYNLLYLEKKNAKYYMDLHKNNLEKIYANIITAKNKCLRDESNLYNITTNLIELEFNLIEFIFNYIDINIFSNFIEAHIKIKRYIYEKINVFDTNYEQYIIWYNRVIRHITEGIDNKYIDNEEYENFEDFFKRIITSIDSPSTI